LKGNVNKGECVYLACVGGIAGICAIGVFNAVGDTIAIGIRAVWIGPGEILVEIRKPIVVGIERGGGDERVQTMQQLPPIGYSITIGIEIRGVCTSCHFLGIGETVPIDICRVPIRNTVAITVLVIRIKTEADFICSGSGVASSHYRQSLAKMLKCDT
jgi:hypothetical protein